jgi:hypothetical protein
MEEKSWEALPGSRRDEVMKQYGEWVDDLRARGQYLGGAKLQGSSSATTVRRRDGKPALTDGPFAETKEQLGGYHLLECADLDEALACARGVPTLAVGGAIEVRPLAYATGAAGRERAGTDTPGLRSVATNESVT